MWEILLFLFWAPSTKSISFHVMGGPILDLALQVWRSDWNREQDWLHFKDIMPAKYCYLLLNSFSWFRFSYMSSYMTLYQCIKTTMLTLNKFFSIPLDIGTSHYSFIFFEGVIFSSKLNLSKSIFLFIRGKSRYMEMCTCCVIQHCDCCLNRLMRDCSNSLKWALIRNIQATWWMTGHIGVLCSCWLTCEVDEL